MKKIRKFILLNLILAMSVSCTSLKEGLTNQKKKSSDEFFVEKKSPLVMPPNFNELPVPKSNNQKIKKNEETIESLISNSESQTEKNTKNTDQNLEKTILDKIKE